MGDPLDRECNDNEYYNNNNASYYYIPPTLFFPFRGKGKKGLSYIINFFFILNSLPRLSPEDKKEVGEGIVIISIVVMVVVIVAKIRQFYAGKPQFKHNDNSINYPYTPKLRAQEVDMSNLGKQPSTPNTKFTAQQVMKIREDYEIWCAAGGRTSAFVYQQADNYLVGAETIRRILRGETFRHVAGAKQLTDGAGERALLEASGKKLAKLLEKGGEAVPVEEKSLDPRELLERFGSDIAKERAAHPDALMRELVEEDPFAGPENV